MKIGKTVKIHENGRITIPKDIYNIFKLKQGDYVYVYYDNGKIIVEPVKETVK